MTQSGRLSAWHHQIRITGGEPLSQKRHPVLCKRAADVRGITELCLTTNGTALSRLARSPMEPGRRYRINLSLDTLNPEKYAYMTKDSRLDEARQAFIAPGCRVFTGQDQCGFNWRFNEDEIPALAALSVDQPIDVRFIELMPMYDSGKEFGADAFIL